MASESHGSELYNMIKWLQELEPTYRFGYMYHPYCKDEFLGRSSSKID